VRYSRDGEGEFLLRRTEVFGGPWSGNYALFIIPNERDEFGAGNSRLCRIPPIFRDLAPKYEAFESSDLGKPFRVAVGTGNRQAAVQRRGQSAAVGIPVSDTLNRLPSFRESSRGKQNA